MGVPAHCSPYTHGLLQVRSRTVQSLNSHGGRPCRCPGTALSPCHPRSLRPHGPVCLGPSISFTRLDRSLPRRRKDAAQSRAQRCGALFAFWRMVFGWRLARRKTASGQTGPLAPQRGRVSVLLGRLLGEDWGACDKCGGQMKRFRNVITPCGPQEPRRVIKLSAERGPAVVAKAASARPGLG